MFSLLAEWQSTWALRSEKRGDGAVISLDDFDDNWVGDEHASCAGSNPRQDSGLTPVWLRDGAARVAAKMARGGGTSPVDAAFRLFWRLALASIVLALGWQAAAQSTPPTLQDKVMLANRFRPFVMTSLNGNGPETFRPATWQWLVARSTLVQGYESYPCIHNVIRINFGSDDHWPQGSSVSLAGKVVDTAALSENQGLILEVPNASVVGVNGTLVKPAYALHLNDAPPGTEDYKHGEPWADVLSSGDGFYAHVEQIKDLSGNPLPLYNIEYTIFWAYNSSYCDNHNGDITTMVVVYDKRIDQITRVAYSVHGTAIEQFNIAKANQYDSYALLWQDAMGAVQSVPSISFEIADDRQYQQGNDHSPGTPVVYFVPDPDTGLYEHPVAMAEVGGHEMWPNTTGSVIAASAHFAEGLSFLTPKAVVIQGANGATSPSGMKMLQNDTFNDPNAPFLYFSGLMGTDPNPPMRHRTWYWPEGRVGPQAGVPVDCSKPATTAVTPLNRFKLPDNMFTDPELYDPYCPLKTDTATFNWPPDSDYAGEAPYVVVSSQVLPLPMTSQPAGRSGVKSSLNAKVQMPPAKMNIDSAPFADVLVALSVTPCGGVMKLEPGKYHVPFTLKRQCSSGSDSNGPITFVAKSGPVMLTK